MNHQINLNDYELEALNRVLEVIAPIMQNAGCYEIAIDNYTDHKTEIRFSDDTLRDINSLIEKIGRL